MISKTVQDFGLRKEKMKLDTEEENDEQNMVLRSATHTNGIEKLYLRRRTSHERTKILN
jgi:hypothetical protein